MDVRGGLVCLGSSRLTYHDVIFAVCVLFCKMSINIHLQTYILNHIQAIFSLCYWSVYFIVNREQLFKVCVNVSAINYSTIICLMVSDDCIPAS